MPPSPPASSSLSRAQAQGNPKNKTPHPNPSNTTVAMDFVRITVGDDLVLYLFGKPGQRRFDFMWEILAEGMLGFVVMVDSTKPETFREAKSILETFRAYAPTPYVVAANKQDIPDAWPADDLRIALRIEENVKLLPCVAKDKESVKNVLLQLLDSILEEMDTYYEHTIPLRLASPS